ncbi:uncharacterized protein LOC131242847 [Magnolia sinica]|uniref:uncharacterized protein LOC131242847 n=1 Tax=Magnolia sinica TaxID=86752 RepID=UPI002658BCE4|nr:uncharacterized protein LOC131242847 [Magnolia sinica]
MGACISKKGIQNQEKISSSISTPPQPPSPIPLSQPKENNLPKPKPEQESTASAPAAAAIVVKKETHVATPNNGYEGAKEPTEEPKRSEPAVKEDVSNAIPATVRTSSCTKEEVDAILIQCGRLSRSSSGKGSNENNSRGGGSKKYSGSKRSYDFDNDPADKMGGDDEIPQIRQAHRRTPSRERDAGASELKRSSSRDDGKRNGGRRASRSPGRRQETPTEKTRPGKMVSVPATITTARENNRRGSTPSSTKRSGEVSVRSSASPRARSPANTRPSNENTHHHNPQPSLSRNSSRKADQSPYRRNPMNEIDGNVVRTEQPAGKNHDRSNNNNNKGSNVKVAKNKGEEGSDKTSQLQLQKSNENAAQMQRSDEKNIAGIREQLMNCRLKEQQLEPDIMEEAMDMKGLIRSSDAVAITGTMAESLNPQTITRTRSSRRSRDLDVMGLNPDALNAPSYTSLLLEDIQNYHQQNTAFSLPPCVSKARSILEAVDNLNSCTTSNLSSGFSEYKSSDAEGGRFGTRRPAMKDPFVESEVVMNNNDLMEPSLHKYVTVRNAGGETEPQESAGSNSFLGHHWPSSWEPNSVDSTERWTSLSNASEEVEQLALNELGHDLEVGGRRLKRGSSNNSMPVTTTSSGKKREFNHSQQGGSVGSGKMGVRSSSLPVVAAAAQ